MGAMNNPIPLSIVTSLYGSSPYLDEFHRRMSAAAQKLGQRYEIILVNDGSPDDALEKAIALQREDPHVIVVDLSRNFGHHQALMTGLEQATGAFVFLIDGDLEEEPEWLLPFHETLTHGDADVVYGVQEKRKGGVFERFSGWVFYKLFNFLSSTPVAPNATTARLMTRRYVNTFLRYGEREVFLPALWPHAGYRQLPQTVQKRSRSASTYTLFKKLSLMVNAITSFSNKPLIFIFYTGLTLVLAAGAYILWLLQLRFLRGIPLLGWSSLIVSIWFLGGLTIFFIGVLGIYLAKVFSEIKQRPRAIVRQIYPPSPEGARPSRHES
jgi:putative glycosyltransferase